MAANYCINATVRMVTPRACARAAPIRPARYALRWADLMKVAIAMIAICLMLGAATTARAAADGDRSVFADLRVTKGSVEWHGLLLGMARTDAEALLGYQIAGPPNERLMCRANARIVRDRRGLELVFRTSNGGQILIGIVIQRMVSEDPATGRLANLVDLLYAAVPEATPVPKFQAVGPPPGSDLPDLYWFPTARGIQLLLRPDEQSIYLALSEFWVD